MNGKEKLLAWYIVFAFLTDMMFIGGCTYLVFWKNASGWWYVLAILCSFPSSSIIKYTTGIDIYK